MVCMEVGGLRVSKGLDEVGLKGRGHRPFLTSINRSIWPSHQSNKKPKAMRKRQVWVEPKFAEVKQWHQGEKFRLRGILKVNIEVLWKATRQNIKQLLKAKSRKNRPKPPENLAVIPLFLSSYLL